MWLLFHKPGAFYGDSDQAPKTAALASQGNSVVNSINLHSAQNPSLSAQP